jgi:hypothetical protein
MSPWIVVAIQSTSTSVGAVMHDGTFVGVDELNCGMVRFLFTCGGSLVAIWGARCRFCIEASYEGKNICSNLNTT